jgi:cell division protein ZapA (FtsZ GTPase activity inhibitor)
VVKRAIIVALYPVLILLASCSDQTAISHEELQSIVRSSISFAIEAETSLDHVAQGRSTRNFAAGHLHSIAGELNERMRRLKQSNPSPSDRQAFNDTQRDIETLAAEVTAVSHETNDSVAVMAAKQHMMAIRQALRATSASL